MMCAGITTFNSLRHSGAKAGDVVAVLGIGGLGHLAIQFAAKMGFKTVAIARGRNKEPLARQLGARVAPHPEGRAQIGYYPIRPTPAGLEVCPNWPDHVYHWHREGFQLPHGAELLAEGSDFPVEAFQVDHAFGFQFHPDVTYAMMHRWTTRGHARFELPGARPRHQHFADRAMYDVTERDWLRRFIGGWLARKPLSVMSEAAE